MGYQWLDWRPIRLDDVIALVVVVVYSNGVAIAGVVNVRQQRQPVNGDDDGWSLPFLKLLNKLPTRLGDAESKTVLCAVLCFLSLGFIQKMGEKEMKMSTMGAEPLFEATGTYVRTQWAKFKMVPSEYVPVDNEYVWWKWKATYLLCLIGCCGSAQSFWWQNLRGTSWRNRQRRPSFYCSRRNGAGFYDSSDESNTICVDSGSAWNEKKEKNSILIKRYIFALSAFIILIIINNLFHHLSCAASYVCHFSLIFPPYFPSNISLLNSYFFIKIFFLQNNEWPNFTIIINFPFSFTTKRTSHTDTQLIQQHIEHSRYNKLRT